MALQHLKLKREMQVERDDVLDHCAPYIRSRILASLYKGKLSSCGLFQVGRLLPDSGAPRSLEPSPMPAQTSSPVAIQLCWLQATILAPLIAFHSASIYLAALPSCRSRVAAAQMKPYLCV